MILTGVVLIPDGTINDNGRKYPLEILKSFDDCDIPLTYEEGKFPEKLTTSNLVGIAHVKVDGNKLVGEAEILDSRAEEIGAALKKYSLTFGCSGYGNMNDRNEVTDYQMMSISLITDNSDKRIEPVILL